MAKFKLNSPHYRGAAYLRAGEELTIEADDCLPPKNSTPLDDEAKRLFAAAFPPAAAKGKPVADPKK